MGYSNERMNTYMKDRWKKRREDAVKRLGGTCVVCGSSDRLEFDHIDPETKQFAIASGSSFSEEKFLEEIDKCQLLCHSCHKEKHKAPHGTLSRYRDCRCDLCVQAKREYQREYRASRRSRAASTLAF